MANEQRIRKPLKLTDEPQVDSELEAYDTMVEIFTEEVPGLLDQVMTPGEIAVVSQDGAGRSEYHKPNSSKKVQKPSGNSFGE